jgi:hypothetical protein
VGVAGAQVEAEGCNKGARTDLDVADAARLPEHRVERLYGGEACR